MTDPYEYSHHGPYGQRYEPAPGYLGVEEAPHHIHIWEVGIPSGEEVWFLDKAKDCTNLTIEVSNTGGVGSSAITIDRVTARHIAGWIGEWVDRP